MPRNSQTAAIVFAVNCPPQAPAPGQARSSSALRRLGVDAAGGVRADGFEDVLDGHVAAFQEPGAIEPP